MLGTDQAPTPLFLAGRAVQTGRVHDVIDPFRRTIVRSVCVADLSIVDAAIDAAASATADCRRWPTHRRRTALTRISDELARRRQELTHLLVAEVGKTLHEAAAEVDRAIETFRACADASTTRIDELIDLGSSSRGEGRLALTRRVGVGVASLITPFNFPLNLAAHKVGPAIAAGCPFILKPDPRTPLTSLVLGEILAGLDLPEGMFSVLPITDDAARDRLVSDDRVAMISFTGSTTAGWAIKHRSGKKRVLLELGGIAPCILDEGLDETALDRAVKRLTAGAFGQAGQSCISVQRILVHRSQMGRACEALVREASSLRMGDPMKASTQLGPLVSDREARRVEEWISEAVSLGARLLCGGPRDGSFLPPTLVADAPPACRLMTEEVFGPVATVEPFDSLDQAISLANSTRYGLQAGIFTPSLAGAMRAWNQLEFGGVVVNDIPTFRADSMPYGGIKDSGSGREGVRFAIEEMTDLRTLVLPTTEGSG